MSLQTGTVKSFNAAIFPDLGGADVFVHFKQIMKSGYKNLCEGERVGYKTVPSQGDSARREARHVVPIPGSDAQKDFHSRKDAIYDGPWNPHPMDCIYEVGRH